MHRDLRAKTAYATAFTADNTSPAVATKLPQMIARYGAAASRLARTNHTILSDLGLPAPWIAPYTAFGREIAKANLGAGGTTKAAAFTAILHKWKVRGLNPPIMVIIVWKLTAVDLQGLLVTITSAQPPDGTQGAPYSHQYTATGGVPPYTWSLASGTLPPGLTLTSGGLLSGTPTTPETYIFTVRADDSFEPVSQHDEQMATVIIEMET